MNRMRQGTGLAVALLLALPITFTTRSAGFYGGPAADPGKYTGLWYEIARTPNRFQDNEKRQPGKLFSACFNATAEYRIVGKGRIGVTNSCTREAPDGTTIQDVARGIALVIEETGNRRLQVAFGPWIARAFQRLVGPSEGNYWIRCLGPEREGRYAWSVVSDHRGKMVWLLARQAEPTEEVKAEMLACAKKADLPVEKLIYKRRAE